MKILFPKKLEAGDTVRVVAPARSMSIISKETQKIANKRFAALGLKVTFAKHVGESDEFCSSSIESRIKDLHEAFADPEVRAISTVIGGFNSNQLLRHLDWELIKRFPKIFCGYSDITALNNAIYAKTGLVTYAGPHYSSFGEKLYFDYTLGYFKKCLFSDKPYEILPSRRWSEDLWWINQNERKPMANSGWLVINEGVAEGIVLGEHLDTFNLLQGTEYFPEIVGCVLFLETDASTLPHNFDRNLQSLIHQKNFNGVKGIVIGRFQKGSEMDNDKLKKIFMTKDKLDKIPIIANVDFGHTEPKITFPIGGTVSLKVEVGSSKIEVLKH